ncbi:MAG: transposase, partial [bacterium]
MKPNPWTETPQPNAEANVTDPDSRLLKGRGHAIQGYNAQVVCTPEQVIVATELCQISNDVEQLAPMVEAMSAAVVAAGFDVSMVRELVADRGYWRASNVDGSIPGAPELFIRVAKYGRTGKPRPNRPSADRTRPLREAMEAKLATDRGRELMRLRAPTIEGVFGHLKQNRGIRRFSRPWAQRMRQRVEAHLCHTQPLQALASQRRNRLMIQNNNGLHRSQNQRRRADRCRPPRASTWATEPFEQQPPIRGRAPTTCRS